MALAVHGRAAVRPQHFLFPVELAAGRARPRRARDSGRRERSGGPLYRCGAGPPKPAPCWRPCPRPGRATQARSSAASQPGSASASLLSSAMNSPAGRRDALVVGGAEAAVLRGCGSRARRIPPRPAPPTRRSSRYPPRWFRNPRPSAAPAMPGRRAATPSGSSSPPPRRSTVMLTGRRNLASPAHLPKRVPKPAFLLEYD